MPKDKDSADKEKAEQLTSHLLITILKKTYDLSLEAELIINYQEAKENYDYFPISLKEGEMNNLSFNKSKSVYQILLK